MKNNIDIASRTRWYRKTHRLIGSTLFVLFFIISITGLLLGWKKNTNGFLLADTQQGTTSNLSKWLSYDSLHTIAIQHLIEYAGNDISTSVDRIDARPEKGIVKFVFKDHFLALQLDGATGKLLLVEQRRADWIEKIHDGSLLDHYTGLSGQPVKLLYTSIAGLGLLFLTISGFWLWYNPRRIRENKKMTSQED